MLVRFQYLARGFTALAAFAQVVLAGEAYAQDHSLLTNQTPQMMNASDGSNINYELGMRFKAATAGQIKAIRFFKASNERGTHIGRIFSSSGQQLALVTFANETASGWQQQSLSTPLNIAANTEYTVSVNTANTYYVGTLNGMANQIANGDLISAVGGNGVFGTVGSRPTKSWNNMNYFRDVVFASNVSAPPSPSEGSWQNQPLASQSGVFTAQFDVRPSIANGDMVVGLSRAAASAYSDLATLVRFRSQIDVRNGASYGAAAAINVQAGMTYRLRMVVDVPNKRYSVYVTPQGQSEILLAQNYAFRDSQSSAASLANRASIGDPGSLTISNFVINPSTPPPSSDTTAPSVSIDSPAGGSTISGTVTVSASASDNTGVAGVQFLLDGASISVEDTSAPYSVSLNTASLTNGSHTLSARARDAAGNVKVSSVVTVNVNNATTPPPPPAAGDGSSAAPNCTVQRPNLLNGYAKRPSWRVAGVDYCVGYPSSTNLKSPASISMSGVSVSSGQVTISGSNITLDGYDFNSYSVIVTGSNARILNSRFAGGTVLGMTSAQNLYVGYSVIDGLNRANALVEMRGSGTVTVEYCVLKNSASDIMQMHTGGRAATLIARYNLIEQAGMASGAHGDWTEFIDGPYRTSILYNTTYQVGGTTQGFMVEPDLGSSPGEIVEGEIAYNTMTGSVNAFTAVTIADVVNSFKVHDNFFAGSSLYFGGVRGGPGDASPKTSWTNNTNMSSGAVQAGP